MISEAEAEHPGVSMTPLMVQKLDPEDPIPPFGLVSAHQRGGMTGVRLNLRQVHPPMVVRLEDDVGTAYGGGSGGGDFAMSYTFRGSIPRSATLLKATVFSPWDDSGAEESISVALPVKTNPAPPVGFEPTDGNPLDLFLAERGKCLPRSVVRVSGGAESLLPVSVENWQKTSLLWVYDPTASTSNRLEPTDQLAIEDDHGRRYKAAVQGRGSWLAGNKVQVAITPTIPNDAAHLTIRGLGDNDIGYDLHQRLGSGTE